MPANTMPGLAAAVLTIFIRSCFRVAELQGGFDSDLANDEITLMVLESAMITIACFCMTAAHPALVMGRRWGNLRAQFAPSPEDGASTKVSIASSGFEMNSVPYGHG
jgi:hypothetical protein